MGFTIEDKHLMKR